MLAYRPFRNSDPPELLRLWHECDLGRGAALGFSCDALDLLVLAEPYFDPRGLIVAHDERRVIGFVHAGFGAEASGQTLNRKDGVICALLVHPDWRRKAVGQALLGRAVAYLRAAGAQQIYAGEAGLRSPFYVGLYGGSESAGWLDSDPAAAPFMKSAGFMPHQRFALLRRDISCRNDPFDPRLPLIRRQVELIISDQPPVPNWWWMTRWGRFDAVSLALVNKTTKACVAQATCWGMDLQSLSWRQRTVGICDVVVPEAERRKGYGKALLIEIMRRMREELVTHVDLTIAEHDAPAVGLAKVTGFCPIDHGTVYRYISV